MTARKNSGRSSEPVSLCRDEGRAANRSSRLRSLLPLVHPGTYPGGFGRVGWLARLLHVDPSDLKARWAVFEPVLEAGQASKHSDSLAPELRWVRAVAADLGAVVTSTDMARIEADWDLTRRQALLDPPPAAVATLVGLRERGIRLGVLSNTHGLEVRAWDRSPLAAHVDVVALSHEIGACKPDPATYAEVLRRLRVSSATAAYVGDGSSDELVGARSAGLAWSSSLRRPQPRPPQMSFPAFERKRMPRCCR
jgi:FMN phosphatase YigB (HAD superfamily)